MCENRSNDSKVSYNVCSLYAVKCPKQVMNEMKLHKTLMGDHITKDTVAEVPSLSPHETTNPHKSSGFAEVLRPMTEELLVDNVKCQNQT